MDDLHATENDAHMNHLALVIVENPRIITLKTRVKYRGDTVYREKINFIIISLCVLAALTFESTRSTNK
jgi:hypothetical protein